MSKKYDLFETMRMQQGRIFLLQEHLNRMLKSAKEFGFETKTLQMLMDFLSLNQYAPKNNHVHFSDFFAHNLPATFYKLPHLWHLFKLDDIHRFFCVSINNDSLDGIVRLKMQTDGSLHINYLPDLGIQNTKIQLAKKPLKINPFIFHKTTLRKHYKYATYCISSCKVFDILYYNQYGEITEGSRSNVIIQRGNQLLTPDSNCGLLAGTLRSILLRYCLCKESIIMLNDLYMVDKIFCFNSVRGVLQVELIEDSNECSYDR